MKINCRLEISSNSRLPRRVVVLGCLAGVLSLFSFAATAAQVIDANSLDNEQWKPDVNLAYKRVGGLDLPMAIFLPKDRTTLAERRPAVVCIHGGAWSGWRGGDCTNWDGGIFAPHARYFAARGAVAVTISYRNVFRPGKEQAEFEKGPSLFDLYSDCRSAVRYLRQHAEQFGIDLNRIAVIGDSAGGHLAACLGTIDRFDEPGEDRSVSALANLVIACNPITDLTDTNWLAYVPVTSRAWEGNQPLTRVDRAKAISPLWNISTASAPTLVMHGLADRVVNPSHSEEFQRRLQQAGVRCELNLIPGASHAFILLGYRSTGAEFLAAKSTVDRFLVSAGYLQGEPVMAGSSPKGCLTKIVGDQLVNGRIPGTDGFALSVPDAAKSGVTTVSVVDDEQRGRVLKLGKGSEGLTLTGQGSLGTAGAVRLWMKPDKLAGTLVRRSVWANPATGYKLAFGKEGVLTWQVAGVTLTASAPPVGQWTQVTATLATNRVALYLNGKLAAEQGLTNAVLIGSQLVVGENYAGRLAYLQFFDEPINRAVALSSVTNVQPATSLARDCFDELELAANMSNASQ